MKKTKKILKTIFVLFLARSFAWAWVFSERAACRYIDKQASDFANFVAVSYGYEFPKPEADEYSLQLLVEREALRAGINPSLVRAKIKIESGWNPKAISSAGAIGLMQVMPANAARCGHQPKDLLDPEKNIKCGLRIFSEDMRATKSDVVKALYRYNGGPRAVENPPAESRKHAILVLSETARDIRG